VAAALGWPPPVKAGLVKLAAFDASSFDEIETRQDRLSLPGERRSFPAPPSETKNRSPTPLTDSRAGRDCRAPFSRSLDWRGRPAGEAAVAGVRSPMDLRLRARWSLFRENRRSRRRAPGSQRGAISGLAARALKKIGTNLAAPVALALLSFQIAGVAMPA
jgi:hypothetical protein